MNIEQFHFIRPYWLLAFIPMLYIVWLVITRQRRSGNWQAVCDPRLIPYILMGIEKGKNYWASVLVGIVGSLGIIALAGPSWQQLPQPVFRTQSSLVIVLDLSRSMDAQDIKPSRLVRARHKVLDILKRRREGQTALVAYALEPFTVTPLTDDTRTIAALVKTLSTDIMPNQGSHAAAALRHAGELLKQAGSRNGHILLITDGVDDEDINNVVDDLKSQGHRLSILGVGTEVGAPIPSGSGGFVVDETRKGEIVIPKLNEAQLRQLAARGNGLFRLLRSDDADIDAITRSIDAQQNQQTRATLAQQAAKTSLKLQADIWRDEGPWLLLFAAPFIILVFRRGALLVLLVFLLPLPNTSYAFGWSDLWKTPDQQASQAFKAGDNKKAADLFENPEWQAAAQFRAQDYASAVKSLEGIHNAEALYNKGNALAKLGKFDDAIKTYDEALTMDPGNADAKYNRDLLQKLLEKKQQDQKHDSQKDKQGDGQQQSQQQNGDGKDQQQANQDNPSQQQENQAQQKQGEQQDSNNQQQDHEQSQSNKEKEQGQESAAQQQEDSKEDKQKQQQMAQQDKDSENQDKSDKDKATPSELSPMEKQQREKQIANEQWLRQIPDDPGGLLRRKFQYQSQLNQNAPQGDGKPW